MTVLDEVAAYLPSTRVPVEEICDRLGAAPAQARLLRRFHGLDHVLRAPDESLADLLALAAGRLRRLRGREDRVCYVVQARTMHTVAPYPISPVQQVCGRLGLEHAAAFTISQHSCASGLLAIAVAGELLADTGNGTALALVLTGEKAFTSSAEMVPGAAVTGECAAACLVRAAGPGDSVTPATRMAATTTSCAYPRSWRPVSSATTSPSWPVSCTRRRTAPVWHSMRSL